VKDEKTLKINLKSSLGKSKIKLSKYNIIKKTHKKKEQITLGITA